jgi:hypothetical protein
MRLYHQSGPHTVTSTSREGLPRRSVARVVRRGDADAAGRLVILATGSPVAPGNPDQRGTEQQRYPRLGDSSRRDLSHLKVSGAPVAPLTEADTPTRSAAIWEAVRPALLPSLQGARASFVPSSRTTGFRILRSPCASQPCAVDRFTDSFGCRLMSAADTSGARGTAPRLTARGPDRVPLPTWSHRSSGGEKPRASGELALSSGGSPSAWPARIR